MTQQIFDTIFFEEKVKVTYCAEVTSGYLDTVTAVMLSVQSELLCLVHHCQLYGQSHFCAVTS